MEVSISQDGSKRAVAGPGLHEVKRNAAIRAAADITLDNSDLDRDTHYSRDPLEDPRDLEDIVAAAALFDLNDDASGESSDGKGASPSYKVTFADDTPRRSLRNLDPEHRFRRRLREDARHNPAFRSALPADVVDRLLLVACDDVPKEAPMRHPTLAPSWGDTYGDGRFTVAPRIKHSVSPGLAIGAAEIADEGDILTVNLHGVPVGLHSADKAAKARRETTAPLPKPSWPGRRYDPSELMAACAGRGTVPSFLAGIKVVV